MADSWGYESENGPAKWGKWFPVAVTGKRQSPIDIEEGKCPTDIQIPPLVPKYNPLKELVLLNTGASWKVDYKPAESSLTGGPLKGEYKLLQMHAHWGAVDGRGSEHTLDGKTFDGELHLVHYNTRYNTPEEAMDKPDGLGVIGVFLKIGEPHLEFDKITSQLENITLSGERSVITDQLNPANLLPDSDYYFTYPGSLTTPPLFESVTFMIYKSPITISRSQMLSMRSLKVGRESNCPCMVDNFRPPVPRTSDRVVRLQHRSQQLRCFKCEN